LEGNARTAEMLDGIKRLGFKYSTRAGISVGVVDFKTPPEKWDILAQADSAVEDIQGEFQVGLITEDERHNQVVEIWSQATDDVTDALKSHLKEDNPVYMMATSGARGNFQQIRQLAGMRGLMADPSGKIIDLPIKANFREGLTVLEYFISTHGARKGLADTALRTADSGYLTRRLVDVAQDVIVREEDCGASTGITVEKIEDIETLDERIVGRYLLTDASHPETGEVLATPHEEVSEKQAKAIVNAGIEEIDIRSVLTCRTKYGVCCKCYGRNLATGQATEIGEAVGIIAAQSISEPGTQLTMRTFHTGGVAGKYLTGVAEVKKKRQESLRDLHDDIRRGLVSFDGEAVESTTSMDREKQRAVQSVLKVLEDQVRGLLRVVELFEARKPKGQAIITEVDGTINDIDTRGLRRVVIHSQKTIDENTLAPIIGEHCATEIVNPEDGTVMLEPGAQITDKLAKKICAAGVTKVLLRRTYLVP